LDPAPAAYARNLHREDLQAYPAGHKRVSRFVQRDHAQASGRVIDRFEKIESHEGGYEKAGERYRPVTEDRRAAEGPDLEVARSSAAHRDGLARLLELLQQAEEGHRQPGQRCDPVKRERTGHTENGERS